MRMRIGICLPLLVLGFVGNVYLVESFSTTCQPYSGYRRHFRIPVVGVTGFDADGNEVALPADILAQAQSALSFDDDEDDEDVEALMEADALMKSMVADALESKSSEGGLASNVEIPQTSAPISSGFTLHDHERENLLRTGRSVGIDLGTTNSAVAVIGAEGTPEMIPVAPSGLSTPGNTIRSVVDYFADGSVDVGRGEEDDDIREADDTPNDDSFRKQRGQRRGRFSSVKRLIGRSRAEAFALGEDLSLHGATRGRGGGSDGEREQIRLQLLPKRKRDEAVEGAVATIPDELSPENVSAEILRHMLSEASAALGGTPVNRAVVTVPAYFNPAQCQATRAAAEEAGLVRVKLLKEPEAAALAYGLSLEQDQLVLVLDMGGGTLDVSVLEVGGGVIEVIATAGDPHLGGDDIDQVVSQWLLKEFASLSEPITTTTDDDEMARKYEFAAAAAAEVATREDRKRSRSSRSPESNESNNSKEDTPMGAAQKRRKQKIAVRIDRATKRRLVRTAEGAKIRLSNAKKVDVDLTMADATDGTERRLVTTLSRKELAEMCAPLLKRVVKPIREVALVADVMLPGDVGLEAAVTSSAKGGASSGDTNVMDDDQEMEVVASPISLPAMKRRQQEGRRNNKKQKAEKLRQREEFSAVAENLKSASSDVDTKKSKDSKLVQFPMGARTIDEVILVGGATRMPFIQALVKRVVSIEPRRTVNPDEAVALGAAIQAGIMDGTVEDLDVFNPFQAALMRFLIKEQQEDGEGVFEEVYDKP